MPFLQPIMLWGLFAVSLPLIIHLLNRLRYRSVKWAAIMFLVAATKSSTRRARLRQYLVLLARMLAVMLLILALARPVIGGWFGMTLAGAPDTVLVLLDRSSSMETIDPRRQVSKRQYALSLFGQAAAESVGSSRFVLIENVLRKPQEIAGLEQLSDMRITGPTDSAADIPAMIRAAMDYMIQNRPGRTEIWLASDLQKSNWYPESSEWQELNARLGALPQDVRVRVLALSAPAARNNYVSMRDSRRHTTSGKSHVRVTVEVNSSRSDEMQLPATITLDGVRSQEDLTIAGQAVRYSKILPLSRESAGGWGKIELPADENSRDNVCYFMYPGDMKLQASVVAQNPTVGTCLSLATVPDPELFNQRCDIIMRANADSIRYDEISLLTWQDQPPSALALSAMESFVRSGGSVILFPPDRRTGDEGAGPVGMLGMKWGEIEDSEADRPFVVASWEENEGPLARTADGSDLPVADLEVYRRRNIDLESGDTNAAWLALASYADGRPFLLRRVMGRGVVLVCTSNPLLGWSNLGGGRGSSAGPLVLVPMMQRALWSGSTRLTKAESGICGEWRDIGEMRWTSSDSDDGKNVLWHAGVYRSGPRMVALNRPEREDMLELVTARDVEGLFAGRDVQVMDQLVGSTTEKLRSEIWQLFLYLCLAFMLIETGLLLSQAIARTGGKDGS